MTTPVPDRRTGGVAVAAGLLLAASVGAELLHPVQRADGTVTEVAGYALYLTGWTLGAAALVVALRRLRGAAGPMGRAGRIGFALGITGAVLLTAFGVIGLVTALASGTPVEWSFLLFAVGLLLLVAGAVPLALGIRRSVPRWWRAVLVAGAGAAVALLAEADPWHDLGLFVFDAAWVALGLGLLASRTTAPAALPPGERSRA